MNSDFTQLFWAGTLIVAMIVHVAYLSDKRRQISFQDVHLVMFYFWMGPTVYLAYASSRFGLPPFSEATVTKTYISMWLYIIGVLSTKLLNGPNKIASLADGSTVAVGAVGYAALNIYTIPYKLIVGTLVFALFTNITLFFVYGVGFYGAAKNDLLLAIPYPIMIVQLLTTNGLIPTLFFWAWSVIFSKSPAKTLAVFIIVETLFFHLMTLSRSQIIFDAALIFLAYIVTVKRISSKSLAIWASAGAFMYFVVIPILFGIRIAGLNISNVGGIQHFTDSLEAWWSGRFDYAAANEAKTNLASRTLIMGFNYAVMDGLDTHSPMYGSALYSSVISVIPRVFYFGATKVMYSSEAAIEIYFTGSGADTSDNWAITGLADFGIIGGLWIGLLFGFCQAMGQRVIFSTFRWTPFFAICVIGEYFNSLIFTEQSPEALWASYRDLIIIFAGLSVIGYFLSLSRDGINNHLLNANSVSGS